AVVLPGRGEWHVLATGVRPGERWLVDGRRERGRVRHLDRSDEPPRAVAPVRVVVVDRPQSRPRGLTRPHHDPSRERLRRRQDQLPDVGPSRCLRPRVLTRGDLSKWSEWWPYPDSKSG